MAEARPRRTLGPLDQAFWAWCGRGELRLQRCGACGHLAWPPVAACECCGAAALAWERLSGRGRTVSWCTFAYDYYKGVMPVPYDTILVELEEGALFISNPEGIGRDELAEGLAVEVAFRDCEDVAGPFRLPIFCRADHPPGDSTA